MLSTFLAWRLNKSAKVPKRHPEKVIETLNIQPGQHIVDLGSGGGYFAIRFAELVGPTGKIFAVDTNEGMLRQLMRNAKQNNLNNITPVVTPGGCPELSTNTIDLAFSRDAYHHLDNHIAYFQQLKEYLKPNARVAIVDYVKHGFLSFLATHYSDPKRVLEEMHAAGYACVETHDFVLPEQSFQIFSPNNRTAVAIYKDEK